MPVRGLGYKRDPADCRDAPLGVLLGAVASSPPPARASVRHPLVNPRDQGGTNSCTGQAWSQAVRIAWLLAGRNCPELSAFHNYFHSRAMFGAQRRDEGSYLRTGAKAVMKFGCATAEAWPFKEYRVNTRPSWAAEWTAHDSRGVRGYYRLFGTDDVRRAIASGAPVVGGWSVDKSFINHQGSTVIHGTDTAEVVGGHAVVVESYDSDGTFSILNSWSASWGDNGRARVSTAWLASGHDMWAVAV